MRTYTNEEMMAIIEKIDTSNLASGGLLNAEQAKTFWQMTFDATPFSKLHRKETRKAKQGEIDKIAIGGRLLRKKVEGADDNYRAGVNHGKIEYSTVASRLPWEITEETLRENIEGEAYEDRVMGMMTTQTGIDLEDLHFNGDKTSGDPFLNINDGWLAKIRANNAHVISHSAIDAAFGKKTLFGALKSLPNKFRSAKNMWMMSPNRRTAWIEYLTGRATGAGDAALLGAGDQVSRPLGYGICEIPSLADDILLFGDPQNFIAVNTYDVRIRKTTEGREAVMQDKRLYVIHFDDDAVIQEYDAVVMVEDIPATLATA